MHLPYINHLEVNMITELAYMALLVFGFTGGCFLALPLATIVVDLVDKNDVTK